MTEQDITKILVGRHPISIIGLGALLDELSATHADRTDDEVRDEMLERLSKTNYIPGGAREDYGRAFIREFRKRLGQPYTEAPREGLDVKVLGTGCGQCDKLVQLVMEVLTEIKTPASVEHVKDLREIAGYGLLGLPALIINGKAVFVGSVPPKNRIKGFLLEASSTLDEERGK